MHIFFNPNPKARRVGDCTIRALCRATDSDWISVYLRLCIFGLLQYDMPSANAVWGRYLKSKGFRREIIPDSCPDCYTVEDFCQDHPKGVYVLAVGGHVLTVVDGDYYDSWDSGNETPVYYWTKEE